MKTFKASSTSSSLIFELNIPKFKILFIIVGMFISMVTVYTFSKKDKKNTTKTLSIWSRNTSKDIYEEPKKLETLIRKLEDTCLTNNTPKNRCELSKCKAKFIKYLKIQVLS